MSRTLKFTIILIISIMIISFNNIQSAYALDGSRFFSGLLFFSGLGASFAGAITQGQANAIYDDYLQSAIQADMDRLINDYSQKRQQSIVASRVGLGLTMGAIIISLFDAFGTPQINTQSAFGNNNEDFFGGIASTKIQNGEIKLSFNHHF